MKQENPVRFPGRKGRGIPNLNPALRVGRPPHKGVTGDRWLVKYGEYGERGEGVY
jgi:hypothetical protein